MEIPLESLLGIASNFERSNLKLGRNSKKIKDGVPDAKLPLRTFPQRVKDSVNIIAEDYGN
jgi:hypothetical protein